MDNWTDGFSGTDTSNAFDNDFSGTGELVTADYTPVDYFDTSFAQYHGQDIFHFNDPLKHVYQFEFEPLNLDIPNTHFVQPHYVDSYVRSDGTFVEGYYRDGDGNPNIDTTIDQGGGYVRSNPDGNPFNNLK
ncbi:hypothetical protein [Planococcus massiliensis]|uniref:hypothetical protein n=1 Tax=Planococcus massiliensis TaxID=1499687 RepID=UPI000698F2F6|nr:hypothetical protein [Planococcus massiliensis]